MLRSGCPLPPAPQLQHYLMFVHHRSLTAKAWFRTNPSAFGGHAITTGDDYYTRLLWNSALIGVNV